MEAGNSVGAHIVQAPKEYSLCSGCHSCEMVCSLVHDGVTGPQHGRIKLEVGLVSEMYHRALACQQCNDHPCYEACPKKDEAMCVDAETGIVYIDEDKCIGCGKCAKACKFTPSRINLVRGKNHAKEDRKAKKCDLCRGREGGPACVEYCPARCLAVSGGELPWDKEKAETKGATGIYAATAKEGEVA